MPTEIENNNTREKANLITVGSTVTGIISARNDVDCFKINFPSEGKASFRFTVPSGMNYRIRIFNGIESSAECVAESTSTAPSTTRTLVCSVSPKKTYYIVISPQNTTNNYDPNASYSLRTTFENYNYAIYPCKYMNITQKFDGTTSHAPYSTGTPCDYPTDDNCREPNKERSYMYCPCDEMEVYRIYTTGSCNSIWLKSTSKVTMPCGKDYLVMMVLHVDDSDLNNLSVGQKFKRGEPMFLEGMDGTNNYHFHISIGTGNGFSTSTGWTQNSNQKWVLAPAGEVIKIEEGFYLDPSFTTVNSTGGITFTEKP